MKRILSMLIVLSMLLCLTACGTSETNEPAASAETSASVQAQDTEPLYTATKSELEEQTAIDQMLLAEAEAGYTFDEPLVVVDPYGNAPLSALVIFDTEEEAEVSMTVKGHNEKDDITASFTKGKRHILPIHGLYAGQETEVELKLSNGAVQTLSIATDPLEQNIAKGEIIELDPNFYDFSELSFVYNPFDIAGYDSEGDVRYYSSVAATPLTRLSNGHYIGYTKGILPGVASAAYAGIIEFDLIGRVFNQYELPGGVHHETIELPNGNLLVSTAHDNRAVTDDRIVEIDPKTGSVVWELDLCQMMDMKDGSCANRTDEDWFHHNSLWYDEETDCVLLSGRHVDAIVCVEKSTKMLKWILGTNEGWTNTDASLFFTPKGDENFEWQYEQHNVSVIPDHDSNPATMDILLFDNGCIRAKTTSEIPAVSGKDVYSRAVVYHINSDEMTISQEWEYGKDRGDAWYSSYISGATYDQTDDTFWICSGGIRYDATTGSYDVPIGSTGSGDVVGLTYLDAVSPDGTLKYEMKLYRNSFRITRMSPYDAQATALDLTVSGNRFVIE